MLCTQKSHRQETRDAGLRALYALYDQTFPIWRQICPYAPTGSSQCLHNSLAGSERYHNQPCPVGHYCPAGTSRPRPCPAGTFGGNNQAAEAEECQPCPPGTFSALPGQAACLPCGSAAFSLPGEPRAMLVSDGCVILICSCNLRIRRVLGCNPHVTSDGGPEELHCGRKCRSAALCAWPPSGLWARSWLSS